MQQHLHTQGVDSFVYDCPTPAIANLRVESSTVESLFFVHDLKLTSLDISSTCITDVSPLSGHRLLSISFDTQLVTNGISAVRHMRTLQKINGRRPAEFWQRYDEGHFNPKQDEGVPWPKHGYIETFKISQSPQTEESNKSIQAIPEGAPD